MKRCKRTHRTYSRISMLESCVTASRKETGSVIWISVTMIVSETIGGRETQQVIRLYDGRLGNEDLVRFVKRERSLIASNLKEPRLGLTTYKKLGNDEADRAINPFKSLSTVSGCCGQRRFCASCSLLVPSPSL